jgi:transposase-like protein
MRQCPKCKSEELRKDGIVKHKQRFKCKECNYRFTVEYIGKPELLKRNALILYLEGLGFRSIGRYLKISHVAVYNWIKEYGEKLDELRSSEGIEVVEMDEMHTYVGSKKTTVGSGLLLIDMAKGSSIVLLAQEGVRQGKGFGKK